MNTPSHENGHRPKRRAVVAGFGPVGRAVANGLEVAGLDVTIVETNADTIDRQAEMGRNVILGDVADPQVLRKARLDTADALIITIPDENQVLKACQAARQVAPGVFISARTNHLSKGMLATQAGADHVTVEELVTAEAMQLAVLDGLRLDARRGNRVHEPDER